MNTENKKPRKVSSLGIVGILFSGVGVKWLFVCIFFLLLVFNAWRMIAYVSKIDANRARGVRFFAIWCIVLLIGGSFFEELGPKIPPSVYINQDDVNLLMARRLWITYDPITYNPYKSPNPDIPSMEKELSWIKNARFTGIITFNSRDNFSKIPELAKKQGLSVIMGIWNPLDRQELANAIAKKKYVDGYCVGNNCLNKDYSFAQLTHALQVIRFRTKKPVSTTEPICKYLLDERLINLGDWIFPDVHSSIPIDDPVRDGKELINLSQKLSKKLSGQIVSRSKLILLKFVTYPDSGILNTSFDEQKRYFTYILKNHRTVMPEIPSNVYISFHSAFDMPWKNNPSFNLWDPYTGLLNADGEPRPAVAEIIKILP
jgi:exo-beta-1,3-glucanase (GH17 family)